MKTQPTRFFVLCGLFAMLSSSPMLSQTHVAEPTVNLGDTSFFDGVAGPGYVFEQIADGNHSSAVIDINGIRLPDEGSVNSVAGLTHVAWISKKTLLGAWYGNEVVVAAAYVDANSHGRTGGFGDLTISPLILQWPRTRFCRMRIDQRFVADFDLPAGQYDRRSAINLGSHAFAIHPYYAITAHPTKRIETSWRVHYLWNSEDDSPQTKSGYRSTQAGDAIHFNATVALNIRGGLWLGPNAYAFWQLADGRIDGAKVPHSPEQVASLGPGMVWVRRHWLFFANQYNEFGARNRAVGHKAVLRIARVF